MARLFLDRAPGLLHPSGLRLVAEFLRHRGGILAFQGQSPIKKPGHGFVRQAFQLAETFTRLPENVGHLANDVENFGIDHDLPPGASTAMHRDDYP